MANSTGPFLELVSADASVGAGYPCSPTEPRLSGAAPTLLANSMPLVPAVRGV